MRIVVADRAIMNGYSLGLAAGLRANGIEVMVADRHVLTFVTPQRSIPGTASPGSALRRE